MDCINRTLVGQPMPDKPWTTSGHIDVHTSNRRPPSSRFKRVYIFPLLTVQNR
ncbi:hypothetical protein PAHAL_9G419600 [Panicum hallii]|uniref:Uncharacterized protein n=1 Tax=Panicum hallii TaxID=206008 RepID=A0A2T8I4C1_9POAL|nr:hypothetical protein PAHAL_9G419600 [Panicum hallii]